MAIFGLMLGLIAKDLADLLAKSAGMARLMTALGGSLLTAQGFLGVMFVFVELPVVFFSVAQVSAIRVEEADGLLDHLLVRPVARRRWLGAKSALALAGCVAVAMAAALFSWVGASAQHGGVGLPAMLAGAFNTLPAATLFLGVGVAVFGFAPRLTAGVAIAAVAATYMLEVVGSIAALPAWVLDLSPFHHVAVVPGTPANVGAAVVMMVIAGGTFIAGMERFARRDVMGA